MINNILKNGLSKGKTADDFCPVALKEGTDVEMEHTKDRKIAERIAMDHLSEDPKYYSKLKTIEGTNDMKGMKELMARGRKISDGPYKDAKLSLAKELEKAMGDEMGSSLKMKKVSVASPDKAGLEKGLDLAKNMIKSRDEKNSQMLSGAMDAEEEVKEGEEDASDGEEPEITPELDANSQESESEDPASKIAELEKEINELKKMLASK